MTPWVLLEKVEQARRLWEDWSGWRSDEQQNPFENEQENPQGGGRSSVAVNIAFLMPMDPDGR